MKKLIILLVCLIGFSQAAPANLTAKIKETKEAYNLDSIKIIENSKDYSLIYFQRELTCISNKTADTLFVKKSPALSTLQMSVDQKFIFGLSNIKKDNIHQLIIYDINGRLIKERSFSSTEAKLNPKQFKRFKKKYPQAYTFLNSLKQVYSVNDDVYIDFLRTGMPKEYRKALMFLLKYEYNNHLSGNFIEEGDKYLIWYNPNDPQIQYYAEDNKLIQFSFLDGTEKRIYLFVDEK